MRSAIAAAVLAATLVSLAQGCGDGSSTGGPDAATPDSTLPSPDGSIAPGPDATAEAPDGSLPPGPDASTAPGADASAAGLDAAAVPPDAALPGLDAATAPGLDAATLPGLDASLPRCDSLVGANSAFYGCTQQSDCQSGLACVGTSGVPASFYCKPLCRTESDCATWQAYFPSVYCMANSCVGGQPAVGVCNDHPTDQLATCCDAPAVEPPDAGAPMDASLPGTFPGGVAQQLIGQDGFTLIFTSKAPGLTAATGNNLINCFFATIPAESARFNTGCAHTIYMTVDPAYTGVAATVAANVTVSANYVATYPQDYDIVTHEMMHVVQAYSGGNTPGYWVEGLADYARYKYGINNPAAGWSLPAYSSSQSYTDSYRVTARFIVWLENHVKASLPTDLDLVLRSGAYTDAWWVTETGSTADQLWTQYGQNPAL